MIFLYIIYFVYFAELLVGIRKEVEVESLLANVAVRMEEVYNNYKNVVSLYSCLMFIYAYAFRTYLVDI